MISLSRSFIVVSGVGLLMALGAGCSKAAPTTPAPSASSAPVAQKPTPKPSSNPAVVTFGTDSVANTTVNQELTNILANFRNAKSFRAKFNVPSQNGTVSTVMEYLRPSRFRGTMTMNGKQTQLIAIDQNVYLKTEGTAWIDLTGTDAGKPISDTLKRALGGDTSLDKLIVDPNTVVKKEKDETRDCMQYSAVVTAANGTPATLRICATNDLPKFVDITTESNKVTFEYYDYDDLFLIEKPM